MKNTILKTTICAVAIVVGTSAFAGPYYGCPPPGNSGVRLATDIVNLVGCSLNVLRGGPTVVYTEPAPVVYAEPAPVVYTAPAPVVYTAPVYTAPVYYGPRPCYYGRPLPPPPPPRPWCGPGPRWHHHRHCPRR